MLPADNAKGAGRHIDRGAILFLEAGKTGHRDVARRLGPPDVVWETERIHAYRSERVVGKVLWALPVGPYSATGGTTDATERHVLLIRFDAAGTVERFAYLERGFFDSLGDILRRWHAPGQAAPETPPADRAPRGDNRRGSMSHDR
ncbi:MAG: hypothetical protein R3229_10640 [Alphaproteobacteria bacterium]|nr:hypothetical protein [Alphaproteobacteria bacterium]